MTDLMAADFELPDGLLQYKFGWCLALATSMTVTTIVSVEDTWGTFCFWFIYRLAFETSGTASCGPTGILVKKDKYQYMIVYEYVLHQNELVF